MLTGVGTMLCLLTSLWTGLRHVDGTLPYPEHFDERNIMLGAQRVLKNGDFNPKVHAYPSFPIYLDAAALALGLIKANGESARHIAVKDLGQVGPPVYERMRVVEVPRKLWVVLGVGCQGVTAAIAYHLAGPAAMLITAALLTFAAMPMAIAWKYVGVDVPMALFCALALCNLISGRSSDRYRKRVFEPAVLCGAAIACKFTAFWLLLPCWTALLLYGRRDRSSRAAELGVIALATFVLLCPRFVIDLPDFIDGISFENFHYRVRGHKNFDVEPGWPQLLHYLEDITGAYGYVFSGFALVGLSSLLRTDWRAASVLLSFALPWLFFLSTYKVHFARNLLPVQLVAAVFAALGTLALFRAGVAQLQRRERFAPRAHLLTGAALVFIVALGLPYQQSAGAFSARADTRNRFTRWAANNLSAGSEVVIPDALALSPETLPSTLTARFVDLTDATKVNQLVRPGNYMLVPLWSGEASVAERVAQQNVGLAALPAHRALKTFEGEPAKPVQPKTVLVNPSFKLVLFEAQ